MTDAERIATVLRLAHAHIKELRDAWQRGCLSEHDGLGGTRSNRNADLDLAIERAFKGTLDDDLIQRCSALASAPASAPGSNVTRDDIARAYDKPHSTQAKRRWVVEEGSPSASDKYVHGWLADRGRVWTVCELPLGATGPDLRDINLFSRGSFTLASGAASNFKINCDALSDADIECIADLLVERLPRFGSVEGVPTGGLRLADALRPYVTEGPLLIVDDVLTTGGSMERQRAERSAIGAVIFARTAPPHWITPLFRMTAKPASAPEACTPEPDDEGRVIPEIAALFSAAPQPDPEERKKDSERLDWLGSHREFDVWYGNDGRPEVRLALDDKFGGPEDGGIFFGKSLREAADAAMQKKGAPKP